ncbi:MAG: exodeoxyribonuclease VII small subunit [Clostridia bacterium]|nr:exodeoxyribonuclease VII small subunit [Clostridia bacterium]MBR3145452.1 exodeoxyribonuclease VII small subunit [Clostridia bacterium]
MNKENLNFEEALLKLEDIVKQLESGDVSLEKSIELFEEGITLSKICSKKLNTAKQKIVSLEEAESEEEA